MQATDRQIEVNKAYHRLGCNPKKVSKALGISPSAVLKNLFYGAKNGLHVVPDNYSPVAPAGWSSTFKTVQYKGNGDIIQTWDRVKPMEQGIELFIESINDRIQPKKLIIPKPEQDSIQKDIAFSWPCVDMHVGMAAWKPETLDSNYDLKISRKLEDAATIEMLKKVGPVECIHLAFLGDTTHADNRTNKTELSGNILDVDSRYPKIIKTTQDIICNKIDRALAYSNQVVIDILPGNHDPNTAVCILAIIAAYYRNEPRVKVNVSPAQFKFFQWGISIAMGCHGHEAPPARLGAFLMDYVIQNEIKAKELYIFKGHVHHRKKEVSQGINETDGGVMVETFPTLTAKDGWHSSKAYNSRRATIGKVFHKKYGLIDDYKITAKFLASKYKI